MNSIDVNTLFSEYFKDEQCFLDLLLALISYRRDI